MTPAFSVVSAALAPQNKKIKNWREDLRQQTQNAAELHRIILSLARGEAWQASLPDGKISAPMIPSADVRLRAAMFLEEQLCGKAVAQTEVIRAEQEAKELEAIRALSDDELAAEAERILGARRVGQLTEGAITQAEYTVTSAVPLPVPPISLQPDLAARIWGATPTEDQE